MVIQCQVSPTQFRHFLHHASSSSDTVLSQISDTFFTTLNHLKSDVSIIVPTILLTTFDLPVTNDSLQFHDFLHYALSPTEKSFRQSPDTFSSHLIPTDKLLRHSCDTFFTTLVYQWRMTPSLFRHFLHTFYSASDEFPHHNSDNFSPHTWNASGEYLHHKSGTLIHHAWSASDKRHQRISSL